MAQQGNKKPATPWSQCENCYIKLANKDIQVHSSDCPPKNVDNVEYGFIEGETLFGFCEVKSNEEIKNLSSADKDNLVFLSQGAIQLCSLSIGDWALVQPLDTNTVPFAKIVWPTAEKTLTSVLFTKNCYDILQLTEKNIVKVSKVTHDIIEASEVSVAILNAPKSLQISTELINRISKTYNGRLLAIGNNIGIMFYGKLLKIEIKCIRKKISNLEENFNELSMKDHNFYSINEKTKWKIYGNSESYNSETEQKVRYRLAGVDQELNEIRELINVALTKNDSHFQSRSLLIYGHSGTGKTTIANFVAQESNASIFNISAIDLYSKNSNTVEETINEIFEKVIKEAPSILILDEVDILCPSRSNRLTDTEKRIVSTLLNAFDSLNRLKTSKIFIIATTNKIDNIDASFRRSGRLDREIEIPTPNPNSRKSILKLLLTDLNVQLPEEDLQEISMSTHGYVGSDLVSLCSQANLYSLKNSTGITLNDFKRALKKVRPSAMREVQIEIPNVKWTDIGGQDNLKLILRQAVEWPLKHSASFLRLGITPPKGVLMFGPPGCSKTMIAKALANESGLNFLSIKGPELFSKWVGESERAIREVFRKARQVAPSIIFFDEIDALGGERSSGSSTSVQERVLAQLLTELDGVSPLGDVTILAATNRPDKIDKALLRPGRLDRIVYVPLPDEKTRREIFRIKFSKMAVLDVDIEELVAKTEKYSGAEVNALCHEAAMMALEENLEADHVARIHFEKALKLVTPRTPQSLIRLYEEYLEIKI